MTTRRDDGNFPVSTYGFEADPNLVLGVTPSSSLTEIRDAYRDKVKKHHPDHGGDEWAFKIVVQAYEILCTARVAGRITQDSEVTGPPATTAPARAQEGPAKPTKTEWHRPGHRDDWAAPGKLVDFELLLLRLEVTDVMDLLQGHGEDRNLSCCIDVSWTPPPGVLTLSEAEQVLRDLHKTFDAMPSKTRALSSWCRVDGLRFTGWLSYGSAKKAWEAFEAFQKALNKRKIGVNQSTREMILPREAR